MEINLNDNIPSHLPNQPYLALEDLPQGILTYHAAPISTRRNRSWVIARYSYLRRPGYWIDEFPYASTLKGGPPYARGLAVPWQENAVQGAYLGHFYRYSMKKTPGIFLVVPISL